MDDVHRVIGVTTQKSEQELYAHVAAHGEIRRIYASQTDSRTPKHFFVEFVHTDGMARARSARSPDFDVHALSSTPHLYEQYRALAHAPLKGREQSGLSHRPVDRKQPSASSSLASDPDDTPTGKRRKTRRAGVRLKLRQAMNTDLDCTAARTTLPAPIESNDTSGGTGLQHLSSLLNIRDIVLSTRARRDDDKENKPTPSSSYQSTITPASLPCPLYISSGAHPEPQSTISSGLPPIHTNLVISFCGESISYDLRSLEEDPQGIMSLLKSAACDLDKWMIVAASYRRKGNVKAAISIINQMMDVMKEYGVVENSFKPAFLMLSGCHTELGRRARAPDGTETDASVACFAQAGHWLQKVYGTHIPEAEHAARAALIPRLAELNKTNSAPMSISCATRDHSDSTPSQNRVQASPPCKDVDLELQVMRDRHSIHAAELAAARSAKRKLEDACERERVARRRVERQMSDLERALTRAERREESALEQIKSEVEARRVAEERAIAERKARVEAAEAIKEREKERQAAERELEKVQEKQREGLLPMFESLAGLFQRAAMGSVNMAGDGTRVSGSSGV